jgi:hypothetical protein
MYCESTTGWERRHGDWSVPAGLDIENELRENHTLPPSPWNPSQKGATRRKSFGRETAAPVGIRAIRRKLAEHICPPTSVRMATIRSELSVTVAALARIYPSAGPDLIIGLVIRSQHGSIADARRAADSRIRSLPLTSGHNSPQPRSASANTRSFSALERLTEHTSGCERSLDALPVCSCR